MYKNIKITAAINLSTGLNNPLILKIEDFENFDEITKSALIIIDTEHLNLLTQIVNSNKYSYIIEDKFNESNESRINELKLQIDDFLKYNQINSIVIIGNKLFEVYKSFIGEIHVTNINFRINQEINDFWNMLTENGFVKSISKHRVIEYPQNDETTESINIGLDYTILELTESDNGNHNIIV